MEMARAVPRLRMRMVDAVPRLGLRIVIELGKSKMRIVNSVGGSGQPSADIEIENGQHGGLLRMIIVYAVSR